MSVSDLFYSNVKNLAVKKAKQQFEKEAMNYMGTIVEAREKRKLELLENKRIIKIECERKNTPTSFNDGISYEEFLNIVHSVKDQFKRIKDIQINGLHIFCIVESLTGYSDWYFSVNFNDWGHLTGAYWCRCENHESNIPSEFSDAVSQKLNNIICERKLEPIIFSECVNADLEIGTHKGMNYNKKENIIKKVFCNQKIKLHFDAMHLQGEHAYAVIAFLKNRGFKKIKAIPIKDINSNSNYYVYEVEQISIGGRKKFKVGDIFYSNSTIKIKYHAKKEIKIPKYMKFVGKKYYNIVSKLEKLGFTNVSAIETSRKFNKWAIKGNSIRQVKVYEDGCKTIIEPGKFYEYDTEIIIEYYPSKW